MRPGHFTVEYNGSSIDFNLITEAGEPKGYLYRCPKGAHRAHNWIDTESGSRHTLSFDEQGRATIRASMLCSQGCGWHVFVTDGVAKDC